MSSGNGERSRRGWSELPAAPVTGRSLGVSALIQLEEGSPSPRPNGFPSPPRFCCPTRDERFAIRGPPGRGRLDSASASELHGEGTRLGASSALFAVELLRLGPSTPHSRAPSGRIQ